MQSQGNSNIRIRRAKAADLRRILVIEQASFGAGAWDRPLFAAFLPDRPDLFLVAEVEGRIAAYMIACIRGTEAELVSIATAPRYRRRGVGRAMMSYTLQRLRRLGVEECRLMVRTRNPAAIRFYRELGFRCTRMVRRYYEDGADAWRMQLAL